jgi:fucose permease
MSSFHAMFSFGNLAGAFTVGQILSHGGALAVCLGATGIGVAAFAIVANLGSSRNTDPTDAIQARAGSSGRLDRVQKAYLYLIGAIAFLSMLGEGGIMDWSAIYVVNVFNGTESAGAYGFAVFATMMAFGRLFGDAITSRIGSTRLLYYCSIVCAASVALLVLAGNVVVVFLALALCGLSVANLVPLAFAAAGRSGGAAAGRAMSIVTTMGYAGLLTGPAVLGFVAQAYSLSVTFMLIAVAFILVALATRVLRKD